MSTRTYKTLHVEKFSSADRLALITFLSQDSNNNYSKLSKKQLLYVWLSSKDKVIQKNKNEKKFTGLSYDDLAKKLKEYKVECLPFVRQLPVEPSANTKKGATSSSGTTNLTKFKPSLLQDGSRVELLCADGAHFGSANICGDIPSTQEDKVTVSIIFINAQFASDFYLPEETEPVCVGSVVGWDKVLIVDQDEFTKSSSNEDRERFKHVDDFFDVRGSSQIIAPPPVVLTQTQEPQLRQSDQVPPTQDSGFVTVPVEEFERGKDAQRRLVEALERLENLKVFEAWFMKTQKTVIEKMAEVTQGKKGQSLNFETGFKFNNKYYKTTPEQHHKLSLSQPNVVLKAFLEIVASDCQLDLVNVSYSRPGYTGTDRIRLDRQLVNNIWACVRKSFNFFIGANDASITKALGKTLADFHKERLVKKGSSEEVIEDNVDDDGVEPPAKIARHQ